MSKPANTLSWDDLNKMLEYTLEKGRVRDFLILVITASTGLRFSDWHDLRWNELIWPDGEVKEEITLNEKKTKKKRTVKLPPETRQAIEMAYSRTPIRLRLRGAPVFQGPKSRGKPISSSSVHEMLNKVAKAAGVEHSISAHSLRKAYASHLFELMGSGEQALIAVCRELNHSDTKTTLIYLGLDKKMLNEAKKSIWSQEKSIFDRVQQQTGDIGKKTWRASY